MSAIWLKGDDRPVGLGLERRWMFWLGKDAETANAYLDVSLSIEDVDLVGSFDRPCITISVDRYAVEIKDCCIVVGRNSWAEIDARLAEADAVIARAFPRATEETVQVDTWRAILRHRARQSDGSQPPEDAP